MEEEVRAVERHRDHLIDKVPIIYSPWLTFRVEDNPRDETRIR